MLLLAVGIAAGWAQSTGKQKRGPRAIAVVQWEGDPQKPANPVLMPIVVLDQGRYRDANSYFASPVPMAVESGVIYDVQKSGKIIGAFTVGDSKRDAQGRWFGLGRFKPPASQEAESAKPEIKVKTKDSGEKPDAGSKASSVPADNDPDRPRIHRGPPVEQKTEKQDADIAKLDTDPNRPRLRRPSADDKNSEAKPGDPLAILKTPNLNIDVAVSDQGGADARPYVYALKPEEEEKFRDALLKMAAAELTKKGSAPSEVRVPDPAPAEKPGPRRRGTSAAKKPASPASQAKPAPGFVESHLYVFDLNTNNAPLLWLSAKSADGQFVTVAAWLEVDLTVRRVFAQVTDNNHLDVYPRLEMVDAVDAHGNGRGDLLVRAWGDHGARYVLYHAAPDSLDVLFDPENQ